MTAAWQSVEAGGGTLGADPTVLKPSGTVDGDLLIAVGLATGVATITKPDASWNTHASSLGATQPLFWKIASGEPVSYTFATSSGSSLVTIVRISGAAASNPIEVAAGIAGTTDPIVIPSVNSGGANRLLMQMVNKLNNTSFTPPGTASERYDAVIPATAFTYAGGDEVVGSGATGTRSWDAASGANVSVGYNLSIAPVAPPEEGTFTGTYDFTGSGFAGEAGPGEGGFTGGYDFTGGPFTGEAPGISSGAFVGGYNFAGAFTGQAPTPTGLGDIYPGGRDRFTCRRTPKNRRRSR